MSAYARRPAGRTGERAAKTDMHKPSETVEISQYALDIICGVRRLTRSAEGRDLKFLDYLLAMAEDEASKLSSRSYH